MRSSRWALRVAAYGAALIPLLWFAGPDIEVRLWPVLERVRVVDVARAEIDGLGPSLCWTLAFSKERRAITAGAAFVATDADGFSANLHPRRMKIADPAALALYGDMLLNLPPSPPPYASRSCAALPPSMALAGRRIRVSGQISYRAHPLWTLVQPLPDFESEP